LSIGIVCTLLMQDFDVDEIHEGQSILQHLIAGAVAGTAEHCGIFPIDTIKTNMQARNIPSSGTILETTRHILERHGVRGLFRGVSAVVSGAAPAHALHFATYEFVRVQLGSKREGYHHILSNGGAGICATIISDAVLTPMDAIKQKMQLGIRNYLGMIDCLRIVLRLEGFRALYASYGTTLLMNIPYNAVYFATYESLRSLLKRGSEREFELKAHFFAGSGAGLLAAAITNPFDVAKTRLQTQGDTGRRYNGMIDTLVSIGREEGRAGFFKGLPPRIALHSTSASLCWITYEWMKYLLDGMGIR